MLLSCGVLKNNFYGDHAYTFPVGEIKDELKQLLEVTKEALYRGINKLNVGNRIGDVSNEIQSFTESFGYGVVRELVGHGLGETMHEEPDIPNFGEKNSSDDYNWAGRAGGTARPRDVERLCWFGMSLLCFGVVYSQEV